ncbi:SARP family transcriptional regulator [Asanoa ishikariensis]|uniref:DNA-binding transcriptional activator of the SARP family n=1 Tax=Asanoa ishikariensis TaxID=137265 RepID=A0A1H3U7V6_9ACTN|nr:BTAD domain-containing putative transcriptional regulator [Asanoa ishikariensis]GIF64113.1 SARP family transcriptional regulator [Asanoa ishikariensis]SDZ58546.1 DNA-binding transcriptional activator of the SARP family [Asanoa ishikariensis]
MKLRLLGPVEAWNGDVPVPLGPPQQRCLVAMLAMEVNRVVPVERLAGVLWTGEPPKSARNAVQVGISRLRRLFSQHSDDGPVRLVTKAPGYLLEANPDDIDLHRFNRLVASAWDTDDDEARAKVLHEALALWNGPALADLDPAVREHLAPGLDEARWSAIEERVAAQLRLGHHDGQLIDELRELVRMQPTRECLASQYLTALHRGGQRVAALDHYRRVVDQLAQELGVRPGDRLQRVHDAILRGEPLGPPVRKPARPAAVAPAQLPANTPSFAGRVAALTWLDDLLDAGPSASAMAIAAVSGTAGVGKTTLAIHWAHRVSDRFPDGTLYVNLNGFGPAGQALDPAEVLRRFLDALGVPAAEISHGLDARVAQYRSVIRGRRMLVVLDNARDADHVRPLLPDTTTAAVLVTSRHQLTGLVVTEWARPLQLGLMSPAESHELLIGRLGPDRVRQQPGMAERIVTWCAGLPLALAIVGARAQQTEFPLTAVADELAAADRPLDALDGGDSMTRIRAVFSWSYHALTPGAARLFRLLGLNPGGDIGLSAAASLAGLSETEVRVQLSELMWASLLAEPNPSRYALHDLLRGYATELACDEEDPDRRRDAFGRLLDHYLHTAVAADRQLSPRRRPSLIPLGDPAPHTNVGRFIEPLAWFAAERTNLLAVLGRASDLGISTQAWQLAWAADSALERQGHWSDFAHAWQLALSVAGTLPDVRAQAFAHRRLAYACMLLGHDDNAGAQLSQALRLYESSGDAFGQSVVHHSLSNLYDHRQDPTRALHHAEQALTWAEQAEDANEQAAALNAIGWCHAQLGHHVEALTYCQRALRLIDPNNHRAMADTWDSIGFAHHHLSDFAQAADAYRHALTLARQAGARHLEATVLTHLGDTHHAAGEQAAAHDAWEPALKIMVDIDETAADEIRDRIAVAADRRP